MELQEFINVFTKYPWVTISIVIIFLGLVITIIVRRGTFQLGKFKISGGTKSTTKKKVEKEKSTPEYLLAKCKECPSYSVMESIFNKKFYAVVAGFKKETVEYKERAKGYGRVTLGNIERDMFKHYLTLIKTKYPESTDILSTCEAVGYRKTLRLMESSLFSRFVARVEQNGISDKVHGEIIKGIYTRNSWDDYLDMISISIKNNIENYLEIGFWSDKITLEELSNHNAQILDDIAKQYRELFVQIKYLADDIRCEIHELEIQYDIELHAMVV